GGENVAVVGVAQADDFFEKVDVRAGIALAGDEHNRRVMPTDVFPVGDAPGVDVGKLGERQGVDRVVVVNDYRQRVDRDGEFDRLDSAGTRRRDFVRVDVARSVGDVDRAVDQRCDPGAGAAAGHGDRDVWRDFAIRFGPGQRDVHQR